LSLADWSLDETHSNRTVTQGQQIDRFASTPAERDTGTVQRSGPSATLLGVTVDNVTLTEAVAKAMAALERPTGRPSLIYFVNAHALNLAYRDRAFSDVLIAGDWVYADGSGARWAARLRAERLVDNVNGSDFTPALLGRAGGKGYRIFLLGATSEVVIKAAAHIDRSYPGWTVAGYHHGFFSTEDDMRVVQEINASGADLLLVGMGNPRQEMWLHRNVDQLSVAVGCAVGGLFKYFAGTLVRAPLAIRNHRLEWLYLMLREPQRSRRYLIGNPVFLARAVRCRAEADPRRPAVPS
jgi:N-acetylglucosaminyldiphosphoundecaprenol N-acetyl-beta-D-mannosaminyltransferase